MKYTKYPKKAATKALIIFALTKLRLFSAKSGNEA